MTPGHATGDNAKLFTPTGQRTAADGPSVANIPGVVAGLDLLYQKYGSKKVAWADLVAPAIALADDGFMLDEALPTSIAEGRESFAEVSGRPRRSSCRAGRCRARAIDSSTGITPRRCARSPRKAGSRSIAARSRSGSPTIWRPTGASSPSRTSRSTGRSSASRSSGRYRGHLVYSVPPPVSNGLQIIETLNILDLYQPRAGATVHGRCRLLSSRDRGVARARRRRAHRRSGALARGSRQPPRARARARALQADRSEEGVHDDGGAAEEEAPGRARADSRTRTATDPTVGASRPARPRSSWRTPRAT